MSEIIEIGIETATEVYGVALDDLIGNNSDRPIVEARAQLSYTCYEWGAQQKDIAQALKKTSPSIGHYRMLHCNLMDTDVGYKKMYAYFRATFIAHVDASVLKNWKAFYEFVKTLQEIHGNSVTFYYELYLINSKGKLPFTEKK